ncbi:MAG TPA: hypothetical protein VHY37_03385 [Tepidisphaeraceae bacterium]|jgi:hypothetical protein|nr:hypothetical protein [Tepidisphaeraceae bacterium]
MSLSTLLDRSLTYQRQAITPDGSGGAVRTFATLLVAVPCAISPASAAVATDYARRDMIVDYSIYTTADLDSLLAGGPMLGDRLVDGVVYYLVKTLKKSANAAVSGLPLYQFDCQRITG